MDESNDELDAVIEVYRSLQVKELIIEHTRVQETTKYEAKEKDLRISTLNMYLMKSMGGVEADHVDFLIDLLSEVLTLMERRIAKFEKNIDHRHKTVFGLYTEKAVY